MSGVTNRLGVRINCAAFEFGEFDEDTLEFNMQAKSGLLLYSDPRFLDHNTGAHPECAERLRRIVKMLGEKDWISRSEQPIWGKASAEELCLVHDPSYVPAVQKFADGGGGRIEADTQVSAASFQVGSLAAGAAIDAVKRVVAGESKRAFCATRPPGHHALHDQAMGFCLFNNVAIAAQYAVDKLGLNRVLIVDWDVHHGNGTQEAFWTSDRVGFLSSHRFPFYPGSGAAGETGSGVGLGFTVNLPFSARVTRAEFKEKLRADLHAFANKVRPELVLMSAGFDAHRLDPVGSLGLETEDYRWMTEAVVDVANESAGGRVVSLLEGGYNVDVLPDCVDQHLQALAVTD
jgi:acetoin utilization deacetylase AcuC-like enzyme